MADQNRQTLESLPPLPDDVMIAGNFIPRDEAEMFNEWLAEQGKPTYVEFVTRADLERAAVSPPGPHCFKVTSCTFETRDGQLLYTHPAPEQAQAVDLADIVRQFLSMHERSSANLGEMMQQAGVASITVPGKYGEFLVENEALVVKARAALASRQPQALRGGSEVGSPMHLANELRAHYGLQPNPLPEVGDIVEVDGVIGICTEYHKGWCYVRQLDDDAPWLDFISDEARHGPCKKSWRVRHDLRATKEPRHG